MRYLSLATLAGVTLAAHAASQEVGTLSPNADTEFSPYLQHDYPDQVLFGDIHLPTACSADAGLVGATTTRDDAYRFAKGPAVEPSTDPLRLEEPITGRATPDDPNDDQLHGIAIASGLDAVWARENTREAIWEAMNNREVYATTGTGLLVRLFAGTEFNAVDLVEPTHQERVGTSPIWYTPG